MGLRKQCMFCGKWVELHEKEPKFYHHILAVCSQDCLENLFKHPKDITTLILEDSYYKRRVKGDFSYRSILEQRFAEWLEKKEIPFEYERYYGSPNFKTYLPDFLIKSFGWVELKGVWQPNAWKKFLTFKKDILKMGIGDIYFIPSYILRRLGIYE